MSKSSFFKNLTLRVKSALRRFVPASLRQFRHLERRLELAEQRLTLLGYEVSPGATNRGGAGVSERVALLGHEMRANFNDYGLLRKSRLTDWLHVRDSAEPHHVCFDYFRELSHLSATFIDIGANTGISALSIHKSCPEWPVLSIEALGIMEPMLRLTKDYFESEGGEFRYMICGLGDRSGKMTMHIPVIDGEYVDTMASLTGGQFDKAYIKAYLIEIGGKEWDGRVAECPADVRTLDEISPEIRTPHVFVKIDAEGFEVSVLRGMEAFIKRYRPGILIECDDVECIFGVLEGWGYMRKAFYFSSRSESLEEGVSAESEGNFFFFPVESPVFLPPRGWPGGKV